MSAETRNLLLEELELVASRAEGSGGVNAPGNSSALHSPRRRGSPFRARALHGGPRRRCSEIVCKEMKAGFSVDYSSAPIPGTTGTPGKSVAVVPDFQLSTGKLRCCHSCQTGGRQLHLQSKTFPAPRHGAAARSGCSWDNLPVPDRGSDQLLLAGAQAIHLGKLPSRGCPIRSK